MEFLQGFGLSLSGIVSGALVAAVLALFFGMVRVGLARARKAAAETPNKLDDALVEIAEEATQQAEKKLDTKQLAVVAPKAPKKT